jgi:hypothetical protein
MTTSAVTDQGGILTTILTVIVNWAAAVLTEQVGTDWSGFFGNWNDDLARFAVWVSGIVNSEWATQRRRYKNKGS